MPYVLLLHGPMGAAPPHWQSWLAHELAETGCVVEVPQLSEPDRPRLDLWLAELRHHLEAVPADDERIVLAHSCGATLWLHHAAQLIDNDHHPLRFDRALLVSPPGPRWRHPDVHGFTPAPLDPAGVRFAAGWTQLVVGDDDVACSVDEAVDMASALKVDLDIIPGGAHLDGRAGYGPWPAVRDWVADRHTRMVTNQ
ncbi:MAG: alpha/beta hydrolase [Actinophytocola sp.]|uniref:RBBP9/YdeN family alpha/beta hydrolase n=1 Tax=Actinophytocola sp. TaxID=1872138 RepID=UPI003C74B3C8